MVRIDKEYFEQIKTVLEAKRTPKKVIKELPPPYRYQFARIRDDIELEVGDR